MSETVIRAERKVWTDSIDVYLAEKRDGRLWVAQAPVLTEQPAGSYAVPFMQLTPSDAQRLIDELWNCGLRPSAGTGSAGALAATQKHLEDMRTLVFKGKP